MLIQSLMLSPVPSDLYRGQLTALSQWHCLLPPRPQLRLPAAQDGSGHRVQQRESQEESQQRDRGVLRGVRQDRARACDPAGAENIIIFLIIYNIR